MDALVASWQQTIAEAAAHRTPLCIRGGGTKDFYGETPCGEVLDTLGHAGIVDYDPTELVATARAGTRLEELERVLAERGQMLAFEPPHFGPEATLGGAVAAGLSGPRRPYAGAVRDLVLGVRILDGTGADLSFGGRVMKNVAGFDIARLMAGAMGTLGVLLEISLKCLPLPRVERTLVFECGEETALRRMNEWAARPLPISATCFHRGQLHVRLSGALPAVDAAQRALGGELGGDAAAHWTAIREQTLPFFSGATPLWRIAVTSTAPALALAGDSLVEWGGAVRWLHPDAGVTPARVRETASAHGGHATLFRAADKSAGAFHPLPATVLLLHRRLKAVFDPAGILNPGRLYAGL